MTAPPYAWRRPRRPPRPADLRIAEAEDVRAWRRAHRTRDARVVALRYHHLVVNVGAPIHMRLETEAATLDAPWPARAIALVSAWQASRWTWRGADRAALLHLEISPLAVDAAAHDVGAAGPVAPFRTVLGEDDEPAATLAPEIERALGGATPLAGAVVSALTRALVLHLLDRYGSVEVPASRLHPAQVARLTAYIRAHLAGRLVVRDLATLVGMGREGFSRAFHQAVGMPPHAYLVDQRLAHAKALLDRTTLTIAEVAHRSGFGGHSGFAKHFARRFGISPSGYRRLR